MNQALASIQVKLGDLRVLWSTNHIEHVPLEYIFWLQSSSIDPLEKNPKISKENLNNKKRGQASLKTCGKEAMTTNTAPTKLLSKTNKSEDDYTSTQKDNGKIKFILKEMQERNIHSSTLISLECSKTSLT